MGSIMTTIPAFMETYSNHSMRMVIALPPPLTQPVDTPYTLLIFLANLLIVTVALGLLNWREHKVTMNNEDKEAAETLLTLNKVEDSIASRVVMRNRVRLH